MVRKMQAFSLGKPMLNTCAWRWFFASAAAACTLFEHPQPAAAAAFDEGETGLVFTQAAVAADHRLASAAGLEILRKGGNAVDAAVATSFALSVVRPYSCGIGGGGFMVIYLKAHPKLDDLSGGKPITTALNYREVGTGVCHPDYFEGDEDKDSATHGGKAVCVPGHVAGLLAALEKYGTLDRATVLAPAIRLAEEGYDADAHFVNSSQEVIAWLTEQPVRIDRFGFLWERLLKRGEVKIGDRIDLKEQGKVLRLVAEKGLAGFYEGPVAAAIVQAVTADKGGMTLEDLKTYSVEELAPLVTRFRGEYVITMPPPSSGGIVLAQVLGMLEAREKDLARIVAGPGHNSPEYAHLVTECFKHAFADRAKFMGDPNFVDVPVKGLLSPQYIADRANAIDLSKTQPIDTYGTAHPPADDDGTSHLCVVDAWGNAVSCTETINLVFGSLVAVPEYGFILNDEMDDFLARTGVANAFGLDHAVLNKPQPGKRPLSSMTPTIVLSADPHAGPGPRMPGAVASMPAPDAVLLAGASGGPRIISSTIEGVLNATVFGMSATDAVSKPRFHHQWHPNTLVLENALRGGTFEAALQSLGHETAPKDPIAAVQMIKRVPGGLQAASDPRKGGAPAGYGEVVPK